MVRPEPGLDIPEERGPGRVGLVVLGSSPSRIKRWRVGAGAWVMRAIKSFERLVPVSCTHCCASTSGLSTWSSSTALQGDLVSRWVSRLDAFSGYPVRT